jgi:hypothetical protein
MRHCSQAPRRGRLICLEADPEHPRHARAALGWLVADVARQDLIQETLGVPR